MAKAIIITGGNIGNMKPKLRKAQRLINRKIGIVLRCSHVYKSKAWGFEANGEFSNQVLIVDTDMTPEELLETVLGIEKELGRDYEAEAAEKERTGQPYSSREIDVDILFYEDEVVDKPNLKIPHPMIQERDFVLAPLAEVAPEFKHPVLGKTILELKAAIATK